MMTKYGEIASSQIRSAKLNLRKQIFYLLLYVDPKEKIKYQDVDVNAAFDNVFTELIGFNKLLFEPPEIVLVLNYLIAAQIIYNAERFDFQKYRKLVLDAGAKIMDVKEGDCNGNH